MSSFHLLVSYSDWNCCCCTDEKQQKSFLGRVHMPHTGVSNGWRFVGVAWSGEEVASLQMQLPIYWDGDVADRVLVVALRLQPEGPLWRYTVVFVLLRQRCFRFNNMDCAIVLLATLSGTSRSRGFWENEVDTVSVRMWVLTFSLRSSGSTGGYIWPNNIIYFDMHVSIMSVKVHCVAWWTTNRLDIPHFRCCGVA
jgi:hypothetical protein